MEKTKDKNNIEEFVDPNVEISEHQKTSLKELFTGTILTKKAIVKQLPFILYITFLAFIYIGNRYHAEKVIRDIDKLQQEVKDLRAESITTSATLMYMSKQSEVVKMVDNNNINLQESTQPPLKIKKY
jgi:hypothetical protein